MVSLQVVIVLIQTVGAADAADRTDIGRRCTMNTSSMIDTLNLSDRVESAIAVESAIDMTAT